MSNRIQVCIKRFPIPNSRIVTLTLSSVYLPERDFQIRHPDSPYGEKQCIAELKRWAKKHNFEVVETPAMEVESEERKRLRKSLNDLKEDFHKRFVGKDHNE